MCMCVCERESVCVCMCEREGECVCVCMRVCACVHACVCAVYQDKIQMKNEPFMYLDLVLEY